MIKLLKLFYLQLFKTCLQMLVISIIGGLAFSILSGKEDAPAPLMMAFIFFMGMLMAKGVQTFWGDNLSWLNLAPVSKRKLLLFNVVSKGSTFIMVMIVPLLIIFVGFYLTNIEFRTAVSNFHFAHMYESFVKILYVMDKEVQLVYPSSGKIAFILTGFSIILFSCLIFGKSKVELKKMDARQFFRRQDFKLRVGIIAALWAVFMIYDFSSLLLTSVLIAAFSYSAFVSVKKDLVLVKISNRYVFGIPVMIGLFYFGSMKMYSDSLLENPKVSLSNKITEIQFQMKFSSYLDQKRVLEFMHSGMSRYDYYTLQDVYEDWSGISKFFSTHKEITFSKLIGSQKDTRMLIIALEQFDPKSLNLSDVDKFLNQYALIAPKESKNVVPHEAISILKRSNLTRGDLMNYLISGNSLKQHLAVNFADNNSLNLMPEIFKHVGGFSDVAFNTAKVVLSKKLCREVSTVEILNAYKNGQEELPADCKADPRLPASQK